MEICEVFTKYLGRIICREHLHLRKGKYSCPHKCEILCKVCKYKCLDYQYLYKCSACLQRFCINHLKYVSNHYTLRSNTVLQCIYINQINAWVGKKCKYSLLYKASSHNFSTKKFHELCDSKAPTLTIVKTNYGKIIGGYTPLAWHSDGDFKKDATNSSFVFSMTLRKRYMVKNDAKRVVGGYDSYGPIFGEWCFYLALHNDSKSCRGDDHLVNATEYETESVTYSEFMGGDDGRFIAEDYEVFLLE